MIGRILEGAVGSFHELTETPFGEKICDILEKGQEKAEEIYDNFLEELEEKPGKTLLTTAGFFTFPIATTVVKGAEIAVKKYNEWSEKEVEEKRKKEYELVRIKKEVENAKEVIKGYQVHDVSILAMCALGISMANSDGEISKEEQKDLKLFVGGESFKKLPNVIKDKIEEMLKNPPTLNEALKYLEKAKITDDITIRNILSVVMFADGKVAEEEKAFLKAFDEKVCEIAKSKKEKLEKIEYKNEKEIEDLKNIDHIIGILGASVISGAVFGTAGIKNMDSDHISPLKNNY